MVHSDGEIYDSLDPLVDYSSLSLFPLSFNSQSTSVDNPNPNFPTVDSVHSRLKAMVLRSPEKLLKQAKTVLDDSLNLLKTDKTCAMAFEDKTDAVFGTNEKDHQVKRPALGLKRAKFNAKSMPRQLDAVLEPSIDIDKLDDPEKYFAAYERMENAKKELQRLRGQPLKELNQNLSSLSPRRRRPSLMGKSATYKHHSYSSTAKDDNNETLLSSEETFMHRIASPVHQDVPSETNAVVTLPNARVHDSTTTGTTKVSELDELLSCDYDGLDEAGVVNLLQEKLDIRLKDIGKTSVPDLRDIRPRKSVSSDSQSKESTVQMSPVWSKSPLSSISLLNKHISKLAPVVDPFSAIDIDSSPAKSSPLTQHEKQSGLSDARREVYESQRSAVHAEESTAGASPLLTVNGIASGSQAEDQLAKVGQFDQAGITEHLHDVGKSSVQVEESNAVCGSELPLSLEKRAATDEPKEWVGVSQSDQVERREVLCEIVKSPAHFNERVADTCLDLVEFAARDVDTICENKERENEVVKDDETVRQERNFERSNMEKSTVNEVEGCGVGEASIAEDICSKRPTTATRGSKRKLGEKKSKVSSQTCPSNEPVDKGTEANTVSNTNALMEIGNKRRKQVGVAPAPRKRNEQRRNSLYVAGTKWEAGVRRSTRIKMRPLEYWKGERFLYGRVHDSLVTVIGVKYASPSKEVEQPRIKVKSFVSDQYKDKVEVAALY